MRSFVAAAVMLFSPPAFAQAPHMTAEQVQIRLLENDAHNLRATIGQLAAQVETLTAKADGLAKERDAIKKKCGKPCD